MEHHQEWHGRLSRHPIRKLQIPPQRKAAALNLNVSFLHGSSQKKGPGMRGPNGFGKAGPFLAYMTPKKHSTMLTTMMPRSKVFTL